MKDAAPFRILTPQHGVLLLVGLTPWEATLLADIARSLRNAETDSQPATDAEKAAPDEDEDPELAPAPAQITPAAPDPPAPDDSRLRCGYPTTKPGAAPCVFFAIAGTLRCSHHAGLTLPGEAGYTPEPEPAPEPEPVRKPAPPGCGHCGATSGAKYRDKDGDAYCRVCSRPWRTLAYGAVAA